MKKLLFAVCAATMAVAVGAGVSQGKNERKSAASAASGTVTLYGWSVGKVEENIVKSLVKGFEKKYPKINVEYDSSPSYDQTMLAKFQARKPPDVFYLNSEKSLSWISQGVIEPLDSYVKKNKFAVKPFYPKLMTAFRYKGKTYGFPKDWNPLGMEINTEMFAKAKVKPPTTWAQLRTVAQKLKSAVPGGKPICLQPEWQRMLAFVYQNGGSVVKGKNATFTSPAVKQAADFYVGLVKDGLAGLATKLGADWCGEALGKEKAAIAFEGSWVYPYLPDTFPDLKWKFLPMPKGKKNATLAFTVAYAMGRNSKNKDAGWVLLSYLTGQEGMKRWTSHGLALSSRSDVSVKPPGPTRAPLLKEAVYASPWVWPAGFDKVWTVANNELQAVFEGKQTVSGMLSKANDAAKEALG